MREDELLASVSTGAVIGAFFEVYNVLGYGFMEHVYLAALVRELKARGHRVTREVLVTIHYKGEPLTRQRLDLVVDDRVVVEVKSSPVLPPTARRQTLNYLRATSLEVALLLHFGPAPRFYRLVSSKAGQEGRVSGGSE